MLAVPGESEGGDADSPIVGEWTDDGDVAPVTAIRLEKLIPAGDKDLTGMTSMGTGDCGDRVTVAVAGE